MSGRLGVAVIGLGIGEQHARMYATLPDCEVRALTDLDFARAQQLSVEFPGSVARRSLEDTLEDESIDVVSIATFDDAHFGQVMACLKAGKHVFVEKPLCQTMSELEAIRQVLAEQPALHLASNLLLRGADLYRWLRAEIASGAFGDIYAFDADYLYGRLHKITDGWRGKTEAYSVMLGGGIHMIDLLLWLTSQRPHRVQAAASQLATRNTSFRYNDFTAATLTFESGLVARITANFACMHPHQHVMRIFGTRRTFILDDMGPRMHEHRDPPERGMPVADAVPIKLATKPSHKGVLIPDFIRGIIEGSLAFNGDRAATMDAVAIAVACDQAAAANAPLDIVYH